MLQAESIREQRQRIPVAWQARRCQGFETVTGPGEEVAVMVAEAGTTDKGQVLVGCL